MNVKFGKPDLGVQNGKSVIDQKLSGIWKNSVYLFRSLWRGFFDGNNFGQHLLTKMLPKNVFFCKIPLKTPQNHYLTKMVRGFDVLRFWGPIFGPDVAQSVLSTPPKPFCHMLPSSTLTIMYILRKYGFFRYFPYILCIKWHKMLRMYQTLTLSNTSLEDNQITGSS